MYDIFINMDIEKRDRIINAAIEEFSLYPYAKASTNNIVKNAGISKGLLFHYFVSKKELYEKLIGFVLNKLFDDISAEIDWETTDILERIKQLVLYKIELSATYPQMFDFIIKVISELNTKSIADVMNLYEKYGVNIQGILGDIYTRNIDYSKFRDQTAIDKSINIVRWSLEKFAEESLLNLKGLHEFDLKKTSQELDVYMNLLKSTLYITNS